MSDLHPSDEYDFGKLFVRYQASIYGYIRSLLRHRADAEDVLQETASVMWQRFSEYQPGSNFLAWALTCARYQVLYFHQKRKRDVLRFSDEFHEALAADTVAEAARLSDLKHWLDDCMQKLPLADRELLIERCVSDTTTTLLAERLGRPASTVYNALNRIRRMLAECIERAINR